METVSKDEFDTLQEECDRLKGILYKLGWRGECNSQLVHDCDEPFSSCDCGTGEDTDGPGLIQEIKMGHRLKSLPKEPCGGLANSGMVDDTNNDLNEAVEAFRRILGWRENDYEGDRAVFAIEYMEKQALNFLENHT